MIEPRFADLLRARHDGVLATLRRDGRPQLSNVNYAFDEAAQLIRIMTSPGMAKVANLRRDPRASFHVASADFWSYVVVDAVAELSPAPAAPDDATVAELIGLYRDVQGEHPDWDDFRAAMVRSQRLVIRMRPERAYGRT